MTSSSLALRFKNPATKEMLRQAADQLGVPMTALAEEAIRQHLVILSRRRGVARRTAQALHALTSGQADACVDAYAAGEAYEDDPMRARQGPEVARADLDIIIDEAAERASMGAAAATAGIVTVALDEQGRLCEFRPDGTSTQIK